ncbi:MAG: lipoprotein [Pseudomonadota bacterium]
MKRRITIFALIALGGCGQTGDLYLPDARPARTPTVTPDTPTEEDKDDEETPAG